MSHALHPQWHTTDDESPVPVRVAAPASTARSATVSRRPAAYTGIGLMLLVGIGLAGGYSGLLGQTGMADIHVEITSEGVVPEEITVSAGDVLTWVNSDTIPHIITSPDLQDELGMTYESSPLFPGDEIPFRIPANTPEGTYTYGSTTSPDVAGRIIVSGATAMPQQSVGQQQPPAESQANMQAMPTTAMPTTYNPPDPQSYPVAMEPDIVPTPMLATQLLSGQSGISQTSGAATAQAIPVNPYAGNPVEQTLHGGAELGGYKPVVTGHKPITQPQSGPSLWIALVLSGGMFAFITRKAFRA